MKKETIEPRVLSEKIGAKYDAGKPLYNLIPAHAEAELVDVLTFGANKYAPNQWRNVENATGRYTAAAMRHLAAYRMGEANDLESGKHHLAHAMCCLAFIIEMDLEGKKMKILDAKQEEQSVSDAVNWQDREAETYDELRDAHLDLVRENMLLIKENEALAQRIKNLHRAINDAKACLDE
ncbi:endolysin; inhibits RNA polymerase [Marinomonas phage P12026]|uniref:endolysin; inhibits RNA polymerase n=1 Tax=Marinomonas phage P12026 TaxID=1176423 RepID=UPI0002688F47|nr:endolysin; inhibits RNA polymerase [Marinomonas phage P12026]AFM54875.1 hypothetical protein P12026_29 [Marinomonas phage P12026]